MAAKPTAIRVRYLRTNQAYAFVFGDDLLRLADEDMFYRTLGDAKAAAKRHGLRVDQKRRVHVVESRAQANPGGYGSQRKKNPMDWKGYLG